MNKQQLAARIWQSANKMRSKIEANEYKDYILGFIFYKYLSDYEIRFARKNYYEDEDIKALDESNRTEVEFFRDNIGYFISYDNLFSTWLDKGIDFDVSDVRDAISAFNRTISIKHKRLFEGIFHTLETGLSKLGDSSGAQTKAIRDLIDLIKVIPMDGQQDYDVLGFIYEYLISQFAANAGKKAGEFYTPHEVSLMMSEIVAHHLRDRQEISIYDPTSGSGSLLINIGQSVAKHMPHQNNIKYYAQELKENTYNLTRMNLVMRGILVDNIHTRNGDTLEEDWPYFDESDPINTYDPLYVDAVVSNPPYSQHWDTAGKENDPRYADFGLAPKSKADYAFLLHDLFHLKPDGIMTIVLPHGVLFRGGEEGRIRSNLIERNHIDTIIGLPANIFFGTGIPTIVMVLKQKRDNTDVLIVDASKGFTKVGKNNQLRASDIKRIVDNVITRQPTPGYAALVSRDTIRQNDYNLNISRYVDSSDPAESWDIYASMYGGIPQSELDELQHYWEAFPNLRSHLFDPINEHTARLQVSDVKEALLQHPEVKQFIHQYETAFADLPTLLRQQLFDQMMQININAQEELFSQDIFRRMQPLPLIDRYHAYQLLSDQWAINSGDLELLQADGFDTARVVEPNMVTRKRGGNDVEVQEGWRGRIIPFDLVQQSLLADDTAALQAQQTALIEVTAQLTELFESLSEEDKEHDAINDGKTNWLASGVNRSVKTIEEDIKAGEQPEADSIEEKILTVVQLLASERTLKRTIKKDEEALHLKTKATIEQLTDEQVYQLLELKWIMPLMQSLNHLPIQQMEQLTHRLQALAQKYGETYQEVVNDIAATEQTLSQLIDQLTGTRFDMEGLQQFQSLLNGE